jgi:hypothetical protein
MSVHIIKIQLYIHQLISRRSVIIIVVVVVVIVIVRIAQVIDMIMNNFVNPNNIYLSEMMFVQHTCNLFLILLLISYESSYIEKDIVLEVA